jgi:hypothetical protein
MAKKKVMQSSHRYKIYFSKHSNHLISSLNVILNKREYPAYSGLGILRGKTQSIPAMFVETYQVHMKESGIRN